MSPAPNEPPVWLLPFILLAFPLVFGAIWSFVCFVSATLSGYRALASEFEIEQQLYDGMEALDTPFYVMLGMSSYRGGTMSLRADRIGLALRVWKLFPFHPPVRIPWERVGRSEVGPGTLMTRFLGGSVVLDGRTTLRASEATIGSIEAARSRYAAR